MSQLMNKYKKFLDEISKWANEEGISFNATNKLSDILNKYNIEKILNNDTPS